jgi:4-alpha-glucanotransferase
VRFPRSSGLLLHPTSLPGGHGIGDLGPGAGEFLEFLSAAGQSLWQVLPLGPTGYGDSPYQTFSAFAGNPLLLSLDRLTEQGLLPASEVAALPRPAGDVHFETVIRSKWPLLRKAAEAFPPGTQAFQEFAVRHAGWLDDFTLFMALKQFHGMQAWPEWPRELRDRDPQALARAREQFAPQRHVHAVLQYLFFEQWNALHQDCHRRGVRLMGDIPIYAAGDSSDVWAQREYWDIRDDGQPAWMAGVPPDYFSATGQLWGNPIYRWDLHERLNYAWWVDRFRATFEMFDLVRVDHFRGFQAYWRVPWGEDTAIGGEWAAGPGAKIFEAVQSQLGELPVVAENLGVITPEVEAIRHQFGYPGMAILQFGFGTDPQAPDFRPHNFPREIVAYTGTHDNDTTAGWWASAGVGDSTRSAADIARERAFTCEYLGIDGSEIHWSFIRALMASVADTVIFPVQDVLGLGSEARMNMPSTLGRNWKWRLRPGALTPEHAARLSRLATVFDRAPQRLRP